MVNSRPSTMIPVLLTLGVAPTSIVAIPWFTKPDNVDNGSPTISKL